MNAEFVSEESVRAALREVIDPELGCNIVDLGLIYGIDIADGAVAVRMTVTTPGCPMGDSLTTGVENALSVVPGVRSVSVEMVWDPPWSTELLSPEGHAFLGVA